MPLYITFPILIVLFAWLVRYFIYRSRRLYILDDIYPQKSIKAERQLSQKELMDKVKSLYLHRHITNLYLADDYISFEDRGLNLFLGQNIYYIRFAKPDSLYYRGPERVYRYNSRNLETIAAFLSEIAQ